MNRLDAKNEMIFKIGALFGPLLRLADAPHQFNGQETAQIVARYLFDAEQFSISMNEFSRGEPGHLYRSQEIRVKIALGKLRFDLTEQSTPNKELTDEVRRECFEAVSSVPASLTGEIVEAGSPFSAYVKLRQICESDVAEDLTWIDPYMDASLFHRYLRHVPGQVNIVLVTEQPASSARRRDRERWGALSDVAQLFAQERSPGRFVLKASPELHDRLLVLDCKRILHFGGSAKDAALSSDFTISMLEPTAENIGRVARIVASSEPAERTGDQ